MSKQPWQRRKDRHNSKPNFIVRSIYNTVDFFGEFGGIMRSTGSRLGGVILFVIDITILLCLFFFSAIHSFTMLEKFGITGVTQWLAIVFFEINFLYSSIALDIAKKRGEKAGNRKAIFIICLLFVETSNITALWGNIGGVLIAAVMPIMLLLSKGTYKDRKQFSKSTEEKPAVQVASVPEKTTPVEPVKQIETVVENIEEKPNEKIEKNTSVEQVEPAAYLQEPASEIEPEKIEKIAVEKAGEISLENAEEIKRDKPKRTKGLSAKKRGRKKKKKTTVNYDHILGVAERLKTDKKTDASQLEKEIIEQANCSKYYAKKALAELEQKETEKEEIPEASERKLTLVK